MLRQFRGVVAALLTLEVGLLLGYLVLHATVQLAGGSPLAPRQGDPYFLLALLLALPGAAFAGHAAVREAGDPNRRLLWVAALGAGLSAVTCAIFRFGHGIGAPKALEEPGAVETVIEAMRHAPPGHHGVALPLFVNVHQPPGWFLAVLPVATFAVVTWAGRRALERRRRVGVEGGDE